MCINKDIINRQWNNRNHDVFGKIARRQIRGAIRRLSDEKPDQVFSSSDEVADKITSIANRDNVVSVIVKEGSLTFRVVICSAGYGYCRHFGKGGVESGEPFMVESDWIFKHLISNYKNVMEVN